MYHVKGGRLHLKKFAKTMKHFWPMYLMFIPGVVYLFINSYIPMFGVQIAFRQYNAAKGIYGSPWCGFKNFEFLIKTKDAWIMVRNTVLYNLVFIILGTILAVTTAIILNEIRSKSAKQLYHSDPVPDLDGYRQLSCFRFPEHQ